MIGQVYAVLGEVAAGDGERDKAISYYETAAEYLEENGSQRHLVDLYAKLAETLEAEGRRRRGLRLHEARHLGTADFGAEAPRIGLNRRFLLYSSA